MPETITNIATFISVAATGACMVMVLIFAAIAKSKKRRANAELRRQARSYQARIAEIERAHADEVAALKEGIRFERSQIRPHDAIARAIIQPTPILNDSEYKVFARLERFVASLPEGGRLFAQVALVEIFAARSIRGCTDQRRAAFEAYGNMRCDFVIVNRRGYPICGIEYQGSGHHQGNFAYREQIKREVFRKAGVPLVEVGNDDPWAETEAAIRAALRAPLLAA